MPKAQNDIVLGKAKGGRMKNREKGFHLVALLKACAKEGDLGTGSKLHADIARSGSIRESPYVANALVSMYSKCGAIDEARLVLGEMNPVESVVSWNALVAGYAQQGRWHDTKRCVERMQNEGHLPNAVTFICILKGCGSNAGGAGEGKRIHKMVVTRGLLESDAPPLGNAVVDMYAKCGALPEAERALEELRARNVVSWCALMGGYVRQGRGSEALGCFERMGSEGVTPNAVAYVCALRACGMIGDKDKGTGIHDEIVRRKALSSSSASLEKEDVVLGTALIDMYAKCGWLARARLVLEGLAAARNVVSWSALIAGYARQGHARQALGCFARMQSEGLEPDAAALVPVLRACADLGGGDEELHGEIARRGLLLLRRRRKDAVLGNALVHMYSRCGEAARAEAAVALGELPGTQHVVAWSCLIDAHARQGRCHDALSCYARMRSRGVRPNAVTFICVLRACAGAGAIAAGRGAHAEASRQRLLPSDVALGTALVDMYAKCGALADAQQALDELPVRDVVAWNAILSGYARHKRAELALLECLQRMRNEAVRPDDVTFLCVLSACNRFCMAAPPAPPGSPENPFACMMTTAGMERGGGGGGVVVPRFQHLTCMVLALGRMGRFDCAVSMIHAFVLPSHHAAAAWLALLAACKLWGNAELARLAFDRAVQLESQSQSAG